MSSNQTSSAGHDLADVEKPKTNHVESSGHARFSEEKARPHDTIEGNLAYDDAEREPEIHFRTWIVVLAMCLLNFVQIIALQGPPVVLEEIGESLDATPTQTWIPNALSLVQAVFAPMISSISDTFQARKSMLVGSCVVSFVGSAIAPGSGSVGRLIAAQALIGVGFASTSLAYCVPSEILPKKWRPMVQSWINIAAALGACVGPLIIGALTRTDPKHGWRNYFWLEMALWGATALCIFAAYRPPKRHTLYDHLSLFQKVAAIDIPGISLFAAGLTLFLVGLNLGGGLFAWTDQRVLATLIIGLLTLCGFGAYEWLGTSSGMIPHTLFRGSGNAGRSFVIFLILIFIEGIMLFSYIIFYPTLTTSLFEKDTFLLAAREQPFWVAGGMSTVVWGYWAVRAKTIRVPLFAGFLVFTAGITGLATIQPGDSTRACVFAGLAGIGFGAPLVLIIAGIQLVTPHALIATATSLAIATRAVSSTVFTAIYAAALTQRLQPRIVSYVSAAVLDAGLPVSSVEQFVQALASNNVAALAKVPGVAPDIIAAGMAALQQAFADSVRVVFIIAAPFGVLACLLCVFLGDQGDAMTYRVDAPMEDLHAKGDVPVKALV